MHQFYLLSLVLINEESVLVLIVFIMQVNYFIKAIYVLKSSSIVIVLKIIGKASIT